MLVAKWPRESLQLTGRSVQTGSSQVYMQISKKEKHVVER